MPHDSRVEPIEKYLIATPAYRRKDIVDYVRIEAPGERVTHCERLSTEIVGTSRYETWEVHTDKDRYWVITNLTNLYEQSVFPSLDMCLTFHIGYMARMTRFEDFSSETRNLLLPTTTKRLERARAALDRAQEAEEFQAVGLRCREALLSMTREACRADMLPSGVAPPKRADFLRLSEVLIDWLMPAESDERLRSALKDRARIAWQLANSLTHSTSSYLRNALLTLNECEQTILQINWARLYRDDTPARCPTCESYRLARDSETIHGEYRNHTICESCGWADRKARRTNPRTEKGKAK
jgi:hypothetical protein